MLDVFYSLTCFTATSNEILNYLNGQIGIRDIKKDLGTQLVQCLSTTKLFYMNARRKFVSTVASKAN